MPEKLKLHWVRAEVGLYMLASSEAEAIEATERLLEQGLEGASLQSIAWEMDPQSPVPIARFVDPEWVESYPFYAQPQDQDDLAEKTVGQLFAELEPDHEPGWVFTPEAELPLESTLEEKP